MKIAITKNEEYDLKKLEIAFRKLFTQLGMNSENPFESIIKPGDKVFIKPNWVAHEYRKSCKKQYSVYTTITHPNIIRTTVKYVIMALKDKGEIIIGDNPSIDADFSKLLEKIQINDLKTKYNVPIKILDLRPLWCSDLKYYGKKNKMTKLPGDPEGNALISIGRESQFYNIKSKLFRGVFTDNKETIKRHTGEKQEYEFSRSILSADVYISLPKLKTHHKVGTTLNLKGMVGTQSNKNLIIHWRKGFPAIGGDEYPNFKEWIKGLFRKIKKRGAWYGNDTIWRMVVDLYIAFNKINNRKTFSIIDGILGGEENGPFCPKSKKANVLIAGEDMLSVDFVASRLMGFDIQQIQYLNYFIKTNKIDLEKIEINTDDFDTNNFFFNKNKYLNFEPPTFWKNLISYRK